MDDVTDRELIMTAFQLGADLERRSFMGSILRKFGLKLTPEMIEELGNYEPGITLSGYDPLVPITEFKVPDEIIAKLMAGRPGILIIGQLTTVTKEGLIERYGLTAEEADLVDKTFDWVDWRLQRSPSPKPN
jgi:hypothetical protein